MKVKELMDLLTRCNQDAEVVMSCDGEGNAFSPLSDHCESYYVPASQWAGNLVDLEDLECGEDIHDLPDDAVPAVCFWPSN